MIDLTATKSGRQRCQKQKERDVIFAQEEETRVTAGRQEECMRVRKRIDRTK